MSVRLFHIPNEHHYFVQHGFRNAFAVLRAGGDLADYEAFSLLRQVREGQADDAHRKLLESVAAFSPDVIFFQHVDGMGLDSDRLERLRLAAPSATWIYHEGDAYGRGKPLPEAAVALSRQADAVFTVGSTTFLAAFRRHARAGSEVGFVPHAWDQVRFDPAPDPLDDRQARPAPAGVAMVANRVTSRAPWRRMPGANQREALARLICSASTDAGTTGHLYGRGWVGPCARGPLDFERQVEVLSHHRVSVNWDYFPGEGGYFSDRLPIAMLSGAPHVTTRHPGYEWLPGEDHGLHLLESPDAVIERALSLVADPPPAVVRARGIEWARQNLSQVRITEYMLGRAGVIERDLGEFPWHGLDAQRRPSGLVG